MVVISFLELPAEVRNMVYDFAFDTTTPTYITSPTRKRKRVEKRTPTGAPALLRVNKQICKDVTNHYYSTTQFVVGNGAYQSVEQPNIHALTTFLTRVPRCNINNITRLRINMYGKIRRVSSPYHSGSYHTLDILPVEMGHIQTITKTIARRFPSLKEVHFHIKERKDTALMTSGVGGNFRLPEARKYPLIAALHRSLIIV
jgi:hypothetical protein